MAEGLGKKLSDVVIGLCSIGKVEKRLRRPLQRTRSPSQNDARVVKYGGPRNAVGSLSLKTLEF